MNQTGRCILLSSHCFITFLSTPLPLLHLSSLLWALTDFLFGWGQSHPYSGDWLITECLAGAGLCSLGCCHQQTSFPSQWGGASRSSSSETVKGHHDMAVIAVNVCFCFVGIAMYKKHMTLSGWRHFSLLHGRKWGEKPPRTKQFCVGQQMKILVCFLLNFN